MLTHEQIQAAGFSPMIRGGYGGHAHWRLARLSGPADAYRVTQIDHRRLHPSDPARRELAWRTHAQSCEIDLARTDVVYLGAFACASAASTASATDVLVAFFRLMDERPLGPHRWYLSRAEVLPEYEGQGALSFLLSQCRHVDLRLDVLAEDVDRLVPMYKKLGFVPIGSTTGQGPVEMLLKREAA